VNRIGDFGVLIGTFLIVSTVHTFEFSEINSAAAELAATPMSVGGGPLGISIATGAALFLFLGCHRQERADAALSCGCRTPWPARRPCPR
jgi:NADH:ubiquinone oxidoreductase subunit 5 (subunit L)/multisubunit Na+/H+ antiporter MnhA subunit